MNLSHEWTGGYGDSASGTLDFAEESSKTYALPTLFRGDTGENGGSVTVSVTADSAYAVGTNGSAKVKISQNPNNRPLLGDPSDRSAGASYKFPSGRTGGMRYGSEPATDQDGDDLSYLITFTNPATKAEETVTVPEDGTAAALTGTLMTVRRSGNDFIFEPDGTVTPGMFEAAYNEPLNAGDAEPLDLRLQATDGYGRGRKSRALLPGALLRPQRVLPGARRRPGA